MFDENDDQTPEETEVPFDEATNVAEVDLLLKKDRRRRFMMVAGTAAALSVVVIITQIRNRPGVIVNQDLILPVVEAVADTVTP